MEHLTNNITIVKAKDKNTKRYLNDKQYLIRLLLIDIKHIEGNLYDFKFGAKVMTRTYVNETIYLHMQVLTEDPKIINHYMNGDIHLSTRVFSHMLFSEEENEDNSFRTDFCIDQLKDDEYLALGIVQNSTNYSTYLSIPTEYFFKISIFVYNLLNNIIIDYGIFDTKVNIKRYQQKDLHHIPFDKTYVLYWNGSYIIVFLKDNEQHKNLSYIIFTKEEFEEIKENYSL